MVEEVISNCLSLKGYAALGDGCGDGLPVGADQMK